jgi:cysteine desulfurase/selenocysteine lyase
MSGPLTPLKPPLAPTLFDLDDVLWVMHCAEAPIPRAAAEASSAFLTKELRPWELSYDEWLASAARVRQEAALLLGVTAEDITLTSSTSAGLASVAQSFAWEAGDEVVAPLGEFPSNVWPWKALAAREVRFREVPLWAGQRAGREAWSSTPPPAALEPELALAGALGPRTRILTLSWVRFQDGITLDTSLLADACRKRNVALVVDGIQGAGTLPVDLRHADAFATGVHKGLLAPQGMGLLWTRPALRERLAPLGSWLSVEGGTDFTRPNTDHERAWLEDGRKLELAGSNRLGFAALHDSLRLLNAVGSVAIQTHVRSLQRRLLERLASSALWSAEAARLVALFERDRLSSILALHHGGRGPAWLSALVKQGAQQRIFATIREGYLRIALHGWHTDADVERLGDWLCSAPAGGESHQ